jgi:hypothetical protein
MAAEPPKLTRLAKGVVGAVLVLGSSSSTALSSIESEFVDMLPRRMPNWVGWVEEEPDKPRVLTDKRRR